eukprot:11684603-Alexandrium_andersonii.AAC.1
MGYRRRRPVCFSKQRNASERLWRFASCAPAPVLTRPPGWLRAAMLSPATRWRCSAKRLAAS